MIFNFFFFVKRKFGIVGIGQGVEVVIFDDVGNKVLQGIEGEIFICGENVMFGYFNNFEVNKIVFIVSGYF